MLSFPNSNPDWMSKLQLHCCTIHHFVDRKMYTLPKANEQYDDYLAGQLITLDTTNINKQRLQATGLFLVLGGGRYNILFECIVRNTMHFLCKRVYVSRAFIILLLCLLWLTWPLDVSLEHLLVTLCRWESILALRCLGWRFLALLCP